MTGAHRESGRRTGVVLGSLTPHPPLIIPEVGGSSLARVRRTVESMKRWAELVSDLGPESIVVISPHGPVVGHAVAVTGAGSLRGDFAPFGAPAVEIHWSGDVELADAVLEVSSDGGVPAVRVPGTGSGRGEMLDHGTAVPLYYLGKAGVSAAVVPVAMAFLDYATLWRFGEVLAEAASRVGRRCVVIASGDLSHRLLPSAPAGYDPAGREFDEWVVGALRRGAYREIIRPDEDLVERAGECGLRPLVMMLGAVGSEAESEVLSYEGPFGVGYAVATFEPRTRGSGEMRDEECEQAQDPYVKMAMETVRAFVTQGMVPDPPDPPPEGFARRAGAFVTLRKRGRLRGCIGTPEPTRRNLAEEIVHNAVSSASRDPRFPPVRPDELDELECSVDVLSPPERISGEDELDPSRYGVIIRKGYRSGLLLPDLEGIDTVRDQLRIVRQKAGIGPEEKGVELYRFVVERHR